MGIAAAERAASIVAKQLKTASAKKASAENKSPASTKKKATPPAVIKKVSVAKKAAVAKKAPVSAPSKSTEKVWADMASDAEVTASASEFYAKHLNSMTKVEASFSGLLDRRRNLLL